MSAQKSPCYQHRLNSDSAGHKWYNHCLTLEGSILPSLANFKLRRPSGKRKYSVFPLSKIQNEYLRKLRPTPLTSNVTDFL